MWNDHRVVLYAVYIVYWLSYYYITVKPRLQLHTNDAYYYKKPRLLLHTNLA